MPVEGGYKREAHCNPRGVYASRRWVQKRGTL